jgi:hypothetical protein
MNKYIHDMYEWNRGIYDKIFIDFVSHAVCGTAHRLTFDCHAARTLCVCVCGYRVVQIRLTPETKYYLKYWQNTNVYLLSEMFNVSSFYFDTFSNAFRQAISQLRRNDLCVVERRMSSEYTGTLYMCIQIDYIFTSFSHLRLTFI